MKGKVIIYLICIFSFESMKTEDLANFETEAAKSIKEIGAETPVNELNLLSEKILGILVQNSKAHGEVAYSSGGNTYNVKFGFAEIKLEDGNLGVFDELSEDLSLDGAKTVSFLVVGFHNNEETEVQFYDGKISLNVHREHKHLVEFQRAVLEKGVF